MRHNIYKTLIVISILFCCISCTKNRIPEFTITDTPDTIILPAGWFPEINLKVVDCNSPCWWVGDSLFMLCSAADAWRSHGKSLTTLCASIRTRYHDSIDGYRWIESIYQAQDGTLYGWYHNEPQKYIPEEAQKGRSRRLTAPFIGAVRSRDNGNTWEHLGIVLKAPDSSLNLKTKNYYFAGGNGDFTVIADQGKKYFYFLFSSYMADSTMQGIAIARMKFEDKDLPCGKVYKYHNDNWDSPGIDGLLTPVFKAKADWHGDKPDVFWGVSVHYNTFLEKYVMLINRAIDKEWKQEGIYISFCKDISNPRTWSEPQRIIEGGGWYPQVIGMDTCKKETDREAGKKMRIFVGGTSSKILEFR